MTAREVLDGIKARATAYADHGTPGLHAPQDRAQLLVAFEAVEKILDQPAELWAAICKETCGKDILGVDHEAIADDIVGRLRTAIEDALNPKEGQ